MNIGSYDPDHALAIILQAQFNQEAKENHEKNKNNWPVLRDVRAPECPTVSLVDPEWETTDPCPDVHGLFLAFNQRFFWGRLLGVEVKWSPQMTSCAGICVYEGRNGLCSVRLSAPLLKLRPRSDLVETLLHEMIHAYLFVTNNNRDRDGHGPEFHKHMYRINKEAGTNITVYHSFHAEVKVYQQHWWRCDGPCQRRAPFFGMVKRAKNREPGPYDRWWADHQAACGGHFVKVREPEDYKNKKCKMEDKGAKSKVGKDIRNFFKKQVAVSDLTSSTPTNGKVGSNIFGFNTPVPRSASVTDKRFPVRETSLNRVTGFFDFSPAGKSSANKSKPATITGKGQVLGHGDSSGGRSLPKGHTPGKGRGRGGMLANRGGGTLVVTGAQGRKSKAVEEPESPNTKHRVNTFKVFSGSGTALGGASNSIDRSRSRLLSLGQEPKKKKQKIDEENQQQKTCKSIGTDFNEETDTSEMCKCLGCNESLPREEVDVHLESCPGLQNVFNKSTTVDNADEKEISDINKKCKVTSCPVCALYIDGDLNAHLDECLNSSGILNMFDEPPIEISDSDSPVQVFGKVAPKPKVDADSDVEIIEPEARVACPLCGMRFGESRINHHVNQCLDSEDDM